ncbi:hypothetical protein F5X96DRAFT_661029, partial [Biscogniauxia mediterranea]
KYLLSIYTTWVYFLFPFFGFSFLVLPSSPLAPFFFKWTRCTHNRSSLRITPVHARTYTMYTDTGTDRHILFWPPCPLSHNTDRERFPGATIDNSSTESKCYRSKNPIAETTNQRNP